MLTYLSWIRKKHLIIADIFLICNKNLQRNKQILILILILLIHLSDVLVSGSTQCGSKVHSAYITDPHCIYLCFVMKVLLQIGHTIFFGSFGSGKGCGNSSVHTLMPITCWAIVGESTKIKGRNIIGF